MEIVVASNEPVRLSFLILVLRDAGLDPVIYDANIAAVEGNIGVFPRRIAEPSEQAARARLVLREAGEI
jgi:hypothetical protein